MRDESGASNRQVTNSGSLADRDLQLKQTEATLGGRCDQAPAPVSTPSSSRFHNHPVPSQADVAGTLWTSVRETLGSNPGWDTGYTDCTFSSCPLVHLAECWDSNSIRPPAAAFHIVSNSSFNHDHAIWCYTVPLLKATHRTVCYQNPTAQYPQ